MNTIKPSKLNMFSFGCWMIVAMVAQSVNSFVLVPSSCRVNHYDRSLINNNNNNHRDLDGQKENNHNKKNRILGSVCIYSSSSDEDEEGPESSIAPSSPSVVLDGVEKAWRYAKKPLLRIGNKGATLTHGNSLRQLLNDHTVVKVKINTGKLGTLEEAFDALKQLAEQSGASSDLECIHTRPSENTILFGLPGTLSNIQSGDFPPPPPPPKQEEANDD